MRVAILCQERPGATNAILDASVLLVEALKEAGVDAVFLGRDGGGRWAEPDGRRARLHQVVRTGDVLVLQYQPFLWGRWGLAPWLPVTMTLAAARRRARIVLVVHEPFVDGKTFVIEKRRRWALLGLLQRTQLAALRVASDLVCATIEPWSARLATWKPRRPTLHLPVGSSLPDCRAGRENARRQLGASAETLVVATFGTDHPARLWDYAARALGRLAEEREVVWLSLGAGAPNLALPEGIRIVRPGPLPREEVAEWLSAADLFLAPFVDGVSTRRTSVMAALQHGVPVIGTEGPLTDASLRQADGLVLTNEGDPAAFAERAAQLGCSPDQRRHVGRSGRLLYEQRFDWPVIAARLLQALAEIQ